MMVDLNDEGCCLPNLKGSYLRIQTQVQVYPVGTNGLEWRG